MATCNGKPLNCSVGGDGTVPANPDISGLGVLASFIATSLLTLTAIFLGYIMEGIPTTRFNRVDEIVIRAVRSWFRLKGEASKETTKARKKALERFVLSLSDQQLVTGIAILITGYSKRCVLDGYHFMVLIDLAWFSSTTHLSTLLLLRDYFRRNPVLRLFRVIGMITVCGMLLLGETLFFLSLDYYCVLQCAFTSEFFEGIDWSCVQAAVVVSLFLIITYSNKVAELYFDIPGGSIIQLVWERTRRRKRKPVVSREADTICELRRISHGSNWTFIQRLGILATIFDFFYKELSDSFLWQIIWLVFGNFYGALQLITFRLVPPVPTVIGDENEMVFGQLVTLLLLALPLMTATEAYFDMHAETSNNDRPPRLLSTSEQQGLSGLNLSLSPSLCNGTQNYQEITGSSTYLLEDLHDTDPTHQKYGKSDYRHGTRPFQSPEIHEQCAPDHCASSKDNSKARSLEHASSPDLTQRSKRVDTESAIGPAAEPNRVSVDSLGVEDTANCAEPDQVTSLPPPWPLETGNLYSRSNLMRVLWPLLISFSLSLTGFIFLFSGFAMPEDDTLFSYSVSLTCLFPFAVAESNSFLMGFRGKEGSLIGKGLILSRRS